MWFHEEDKTNPIITARKNIDSAHGNKELENLLPKTAVLLYMSGLDYIKEKYEIEKISDRFPRFLNKCPIYRIKNCKEICFLDGGRGAPQAADTIETLKALGVTNIISVGMIGAFADQIEIGDIVIPPLAFCEEGISHHYYKKIESARPNGELFHKAINFIENTRQLPIVSTDAIYRQTFYKEALWREKGAIGVDMETSALFSVGSYLDLNVVAMLMVSDIHPLNEGSHNWNWNITKEQRKEVIYKVIDFALSLDGE